MGTRSRFVRSFFTGAVLIACLLGSFSNGARAKTLEEVLVYVYETNAQLNAQRARVRAVDEGVPQAMAGYRPKVSATLSAGTQHEEQTTGPILGKKFFSEGNSKPVSAGISANQTLFDGFITPNRTRAAEAQVMAERATLRIMEQQVLADAVSGFMDVIRDGAVVTLLENTVSSLEQQLDYVTQRYRVGDVTSTDVAQTESRLGLARIQLSIAQAALATSRANFFRVVGQNPVNLRAAAPVDRFCPQSVALAVASAQKDHPAVVAATYNVDVATLQTRIAQGALYPTVSLSATATNERHPTSGTLHTFTNFAGAQATIPIYQGGAIFSTIAQAHETTTEKKLDLDFIRQSAGANATQAWGILQAAKTQLTASNYQVKAAEKAYNGVQQEARVGQRTTIDVLNALQELVNARVTLVSAERDRVVFSYNLLASAGRLDPQVLGLKVKIYDPATHYENVRDRWLGLRSPGEIFGNRN